MVKHGDMGRQCIKHREQVAVGPATLGDSDLAVSRPVRTHVALATTLFAENWPRKPKANRNLSAPPQNQQSTSQKYEIPLGTKYETLLRRLVGLRIPRAHTGRENAKTRCRPDAA